MDYLDFDLEIGEGTGLTYPVEVRSPAGEAKESMRFPYDKLILDNRLKAVELALLRSGGDARRAVSPEQRDVRDFGTELFSALFVGNVRQLFDTSRDRAGRNGKGLRVKLRFASADLAALPWEFLYDTGRAEYLCLSTDTPVIRYVELAQPMEPLTVSPPLRILGMVSSPTDVPGLDVEKEVARIEAATRVLLDQGMVELHWVEGASWRSLQKELRHGPWHIFHFVGHGGFDRTTSEGIVVLTDEEGGAQRLPAVHLARLLGDHHPLRLAILNSCDGARGDRLDVFSSTAATLVRRGTPAVMAMQYEITDRAAVELARSFYEVIADGLPVDFALAEARKALCGALSNTLEWATPVLYMRAPDGVLFKIRQGGRAPKAPSRPRATEPAPPRPRPRSVAPAPGRPAVPESPPVPESPVERAPVLQRRNQFCRRCGARRVNPTSKFCHRCGHHFG